MADRNDARTLTRAQDPDFEVVQKSRILTVALGAAALAALPLALINLAQGALEFAAVLIGLAGVSLGGWLINRRGRVVFASLILMCTTFVAAAFTIIDGAAFTDPGLLALPILILLGGFFFNRRGALVTTGLLIGFLIALWAAGKGDVIALSPLPTDARLLTTSILLLAMAALVWVVSGSWTESVLQLRGSQQRLMMAANAARMRFWEHDVESGQIHYSQSLEEEEWNPPLPGTFTEWLGRLHEADRGRVLGLRQARLDGETPIWTAEYRLAASDGISEWRLIQGRIVDRDESGSAVREAGIGLDITQPKEQELELAASQARLEMLTQELHDSVTQTIYSMTLHLQAAKDHLTNTSSGARSAIENVDELARDALAQMRVLLRQSRPEALDEHGLVYALRDYLKALADRKELQVRLSVKDELGHTLPAEVELALYRVTQQALANVHKHAGVVEAEVLVYLAAGLAQVQIVDSGRGFELGVVGELPGRYGLKSMRERVERLGGAFEVDAANGNGTRVYARIPLDEAPARNE